MPNGKGVAQPGAAAVSQFASSASTPEKVKEAGVHAGEAAVPETRYAQPSVYLR